MAGRGSAADRITVQGVGETQLAHAAEVTEGFSGRELAKFMASVQVGGWRGGEDLLHPAVP